MFNYVKCYFLSVLHSNKLNYNETTLQLINDVVITVIIYIPIMYFLNTVKSTINKEFIELPSRTDVL